MSLVRELESPQEACRACDVNPLPNVVYHGWGRWNGEIRRFSGFTRFFARQFLGASIFGQASWEGAVTNLERAVEIDPRRIVHRLDLAGVYVDRKRYDDARRPLEAIDPLPIHDFNDPPYKADRPPPPQSNTHRQQRTLHRCALRSALAVRLATT